MKPLVGVALIFTLTSIASALNEKPQKIQKWEYLTLIQRQDSNPPNTTIYEKGVSKKYSAAEFQNLVVNAGFSYSYENDYLDYFGSLGWEIAGVYVNPRTEPYGPQQIFYFKRPVK